MQKRKFQLEYIEPYSSFSEGKPKAIPMVVQGLLPQGGFAVLGACPKNSKSSLSRYLATAIVKGEDFLGRQTTQGDVILASLEDPRQHTDNCLHALGYDANDPNSGRIKILEKLPPTIEETIDVLGDDLTSKPTVRLVIVDTIAKVLRVKDLNDYPTVMAAVEQLKNLARKFDKLNIFCLAHCKKVKTEDPFERLLGSTALRGEPDTNIVLFKEAGVRVIETEGRVVKNIPRSIIEATLVDVEGADVVTNFRLGKSLVEYEAEQANKKSTKRQAREKESVKDRIRKFLSGCAERKATKEEIKISVIGNDTQKLEALDQMEKDGEITISGVLRSKTNPQIVTFNSLNTFMDQFSPEEIQ